MEAGRVDSPVGDASTDGENDGEDTSRLFHRWLTVGGQMMLVAHLPGSPICRPD
jgi:hypothetical protein